MFVGADTPARPKQNIIALYVGEHIVSPLLGVNN